MSFKQASVLGAHVRKGQRGTHVVFASTLTPSNANAEQDDTATPRNIPFLKTYTVFNVEQIEDLPSSYYQPAPPPRTHRTRIEHAERFVHATQAIIRHSGTMAAYNSSADEIRLPPFDGFRDADSYYATLIHELLHWTRHPTRLDRSFNQERFGDAGYAMEELVAELGSAFICADLELSPALLRDNASYIDSWLTILNRDKRAIFTAASHAQRAAAYLHSLQSPPCYLTASSA
jgi:antirestriction protein ArdC